MKRRILLALLLSGLAAAIQAQKQEWYKYYDDAEKAIAAGRWTEAEENLRVCITQKSKSKANAQTQSHFYMDYFPYLMLAKVQFAQNKFESALDSIKLEETFGEVRKEPESLAELNALKTKVQEKLAEQTRPAVPPPPPAGDRFKPLLKQAEEFFEKGDYDGARRLYQQVRQEAIAAKSAEEAEEARRRLEAMDQEESAWENLRQAMQAGKFGEAVTLADRVVGFGGKYAPEATRLRADANSRQVGEQSLTAVLKTVDGMVQRKNFAGALETLDAAGQQHGSGASIDACRQRLTAALVAEIGERLDRGELDPAETLCRLAEQHQLAPAEVKARRQRLADLQRLARGGQLIREKRWQEARAFLEPLLKVPDLQSQARQALGQVETALNRFAADLARTDELLKTNQTGEARQLLESLRRDFPEAPEVYPRLRQIQEREAKSGRMEVEDYLRSALDAFFESGDYPNAVFYLTEYLKREGARKDLALFFRAVARIYLHRLEGDTGKRYLEDARRDASQISRGFQPPRDWVAPPALRLYDQWRK